MHEVGVHAATGVHTDQSWKALRAMASTFKRFPCALEKNAVLRVHKFGFPRVYPEEGRIEFVDIGQDGPGPDIARLAARFIADFQLGGSEVRDRIDTIDQVLPEVFKRGSTGKPPRHADNGDGRAVADISVDSPILSIIA